jgi:hypothetical protein
MEVAAIISAKGGVFGKTMHGEIGAFHLNALHVSFIIIAVHKPTTFFVTAAIVLAAARAASASATTTPTNINNTLRDAAASDGARDLLVRLDEALNALTYSVHQYSPQSWSDSTGTYKVDCSGYIGRMLEDAVPEAYDEVGEARNTSRPLAHDYYYFFRSITPGGTKGRWRRPAQFKDVRPGDMLVWRYKETQDSGSTGHTTVVVSVPLLYDTNVYRVRVTDSAKSGHTNDNRKGTNTGVGAGEILVKVNSSGQPIQYTWSLTGPWHSDIYMAMGRPRY